MHITLKNQRKIKIHNADDIYCIMQRVLLRENKIDRDREHLWTISLDIVYKILNIELVSMGTVDKTLVEPMEVYSVPLQKRAVRIILVHNHPSQDVNPSDGDKDITDHLIQVGKIMQVPVLDHLIISEKNYYSFRNSGLLAILEESTKYVPPYILKQRYEKAAREKGTEQGKKEKAREMARAMKAAGIDIEMIVKISGLSKAVITRLKT